MGGTVIIHSALAAATSRSAGVVRSYAFMTACSGTRPVVRSRHSATISLRARAMMAMRLAVSGVGGACGEPPAERAVRLMPPPQPGKLDRLETGTGVACLADPLFAIDAAAGHGLGARPQ